MFDSNIAGPEALSAGGRRKLHTTFGDGTELIEEYDLTTDELISRRRRRKTTLGKQSDWEWLYGDPPQMSSLEMRESTRNPTFT